MSVPWCGHRRVAGAAAVVALVALLGEHGADAAFSEPDPASWSETSNGSSSGGEKVVENESSLKKVTAVGTPAFNHQGCQDVDGVDVPTGWRCKEAFLEVNRLLPTAGEDDWSQPDLRIPVVVYGGRALSTAPWTADVFASHCNSNDTTTADDHDGDDGGSGDGDGDGWLEEGSGIPADGLFFAGDHASSSWGVVVLDYLSGWKCLPGAGFNGFEQRPVAAVLIRPPLVEYGTDDGIDTVEDQTTHHGSGGNEAGDGDSSVGGDEDGANAAAAAAAAAATLTSQLAAAKAAQTPLVVLSDAGSARLNILVFESSIHLTHWVRARFVPARMVPTLAPSAAGGEGGTGGGDGDGDDDSSLFAMFYDDDDDVASHYWDYRFDDNQVLETSRRRHARMLVVVITISICVFIFTLFQRTRVSQAAMHEDNIRRQMIFFAVLQAHLDDEVRNPFTGEDLQMAILALPTRRVTPEDPGQNGACAVCLCDWEDGDEVRSLPCDHEFHMDCIDPWLVANHTCPLCNRDIMEGEVQPEASQFGRSRRNSLSSTDGGGGDSSGDGGGGGGGGARGEGTVIGEHEENDGGVDANAVVAAIEAATIIDVDGIGNNSFEEDEYLEVVGDGGVEPPEQEAAVV